MNWFHFNRRVSSRGIHRLACLTQRERLRLRSAKHSICRASIPGERYSRPFSSVSMHLRAIGIQSATKLASSVSRAQPVHPWRMNSVVARFLRTTGAPFLLSWIIVHLLDWCKQMRLWRSGERANGLFPPVQRLHGRRRGPSRNSSLFIGPTGSDCGVDAGASPNR